MYGPCYLFILKYTVSTVPGKNLSFNEKKVSKLELFCAENI